MNRVTSALLLSLFLLTSCTRQTQVKAVETPEPEDTPTAMAPVIDGVYLNECRNCHTDKQRLIDTAKPVEVVEKESSGAG